MPAPSLPLPSDACCALLNQSGEGMGCLDDNLQLVWANPALAQALGTTVNALLGKTLAQLEAWLSEQQEPRVPSCHSSAKGEREAGEPASRTVHLRDGRVLRWRTLPGPSGACHLYVTDLTPISAQERRRSEFLSTAAHELRNPVASIFGFAELLRSRKLKPEGLAEVSDILCRQAGALSNLVEELLDLARLDAKQGQDFRPQAVSLGTLIHEARESLPLALQPARIRVRIAASADSLWVDRAKTVRVLINVLSNALKYSPLHTPVEVSARRPKSSAVSHIEVVDQGIGMNPEQLARVFERFYRADPGGPVQGTGLGMSLVQEIVALLGGQVSVQSRPGAGSTVQLHLPLATPGLKDRDTKKDSQGQPHAASSGAPGHSGPLGEKQGP